MKKFGGDFDDISNSFENGIKKVKYSNFDSRRSRLSVSSIGNQFLQDPSNSNSSPRPTSSVRPRVTTAVQTPSLSVPPTMHVMPPAEIQPVGGGGGGAGGSESTGEGAKQEGAVAGIGHTTFYVIDALVGAGIGYYIASKYKKNVWAGAGIGGAIGLGATWLYFNKSQTPVEVKK